MELVLFARLRRCLPWLAAVFLAGSGPAALAQAEPDPPTRVGTVTHRQGGVVFAPEGEEAWQDLPANRPLTVGDRLWTDRDGRAELHLGSAVVQLDAEGHLGLSALDDKAAQMILMQGSVIARVREVQAGENFEIDTPNLAFRALQPGEFRIDVSPDGKQTRVVVLSGLATVFGDSGQSVHLGQEQEAVFAGRFLARVHGPRYQADAFARWAVERNRAEDASLAARYVPRSVVGYSQLDQHGTWSQHVEYGTVWYPNVTVADWAPYRYGRWSYIRPWGWTWLDDAPWGFAPSHYGRWAAIGSRWAWVPGRMTHRPVYAPAMVSFVGGSGSVSFSINSGPAVGWYPLAPGEAFWPWYRTSPRYVGFANPRIDLSRYHRQYDDHKYRQGGVTAVREDDFRRGRPVREAWRPVQPGTNLPRSAPPARPGVQAVTPGASNWSQARAMPIERPLDWDRSNAVREQARAQREQYQLQFEAEREARRQARTGEIPLPPNPTGAMVPQQRAAPPQSDPWSAGRAAGSPRAGWQPDGTFR